MTEEAIARRLATADMPSPDLLVRTGGEHRISNFLVWQAAYAEYYFTPTLWPDFGPADVDTALVEFSRRRRRFGLVPATARTAARSAGRGRLACCARGWPSRPSGCRSSPCWSSRPPLSSPPPPPSCSPPRRTSSCAPRTSSGPAMSRSAPPWRPRCSWPGRGSSTTSRCGRCSCSHSSRSTDCCAPGPAPRHFREAWWLGSVMYVAVLGTHWVLLRDIDDGRAWILVLLGVTFATDTGAYAVGRLLGSHLMAPGISPGKTWEGFAGGYVAGIAAGLGIPLALDLDPGPIVLALIAAWLPVMAVLGRPRRVCAQAADRGEGHVGAAAWPRRAPGPHGLPAPRGAVSILDRAMGVAPAALGSAPQ